MAERFKAPVLKTGEAAMSPWVRIPLPPPLALAKAFSRSGCGGIVSLCARVMRAPLGTGPFASRPADVLSVPLFSAPVACAGSVNCFQAIELSLVSRPLAEHFDFRNMQRTGTEIEPTCNGKHWV